MPSSPHDALFKASFGQPDIARSELELVLPHAVRAHLDLATLALCPGSFVDEDLRHTHADLLYAVRTHDGREGLVYVLFEHQSSVDPLMPFRLLRYVVRAWERWLRDHPDASMLPILIPVVLHHGETSWRAAPELAAMFDAEHALLEAVRPFLPHFRFILDDLAVALARADVFARARSVAAPRAARALGVAIVSAAARRGAADARHRRGSRARRADAGASAAVVPLRADDGAGGR